MTDFDAGPVLDAVRSHAQSTAAFNVLMSHEPKQAPGAGLTFACWLSAMDPIERASGLAVTSLRVELTVRVYMPFMGSDPDTVDTRVAHVTSALFAKYIADFDLFESADAVDIKGIYGDKLGMRGGFLNQDNKLFRVADIRIPLIFFDVYPEVE
jgi:hypothetical protein